MLEDELEPAESSTAADSQDVSGAASGASDVEDQSLEDAIRDVINLGEDEGDDAEGDEGEDPEVSSTAEANDQEQGESDEDAAGETDGGSDDDKLLELLKDESIPLGKVERFRQVLEERKQYKEQVESLGKIQQDLASIEQQAKQYGLTQDQVNNWYAMPVMLNSDPSKAIELLTDFVSELKARHGFDLPDDLRQKVEEGYIDEETARRVARSEAEAREAQRRREVDSEEAQRQAAIHRSQQITTAVNEFERSLRESDPDYGQKERFVRDRVRAIREERWIPESPEQAIAWVKEAVGDINEQFASLKPKRRETRAISGRSRSGSGKPAPPASMFEAVANAVNHAAED